MEVNGERVLDRTVRLIKQFDSDAEIIITSHDERYDVAGTTRYEPKNNQLEIDRFTEELIADNVCFIYGDTYYTEKEMGIITKETLNKEEMDFFGNKKSIVAIKVYDGTLFKRHVDHVRDLYLQKKISKCIGWQVYASYNNSSFEEKTIGDNFIILDDGTIDFNEYDEYVKVLRKL